MGPVEAPGCRRSGFGLRPQQLNSSACRAHYLFTVKANQPTLPACCADLPWHDVPVGDRTRDQSHGRVGLRTLKAVTVHHLSFPHAAQVIQLIRKTRDLQANPRRWRTVVVYAITSLPFAHASPARLADLIRGHWAVEASHHLRDTTYAEDASQLHTGPAPQVMATLRNLAIGVLGRSTSPPPYVTTPASPPGPWRPSGSPPYERTFRENAGALRAGWLLYPLLHAAGGH